ncbi:Glyceraldehyde-3-phosphate dehydrogenase [Plecturocebus cupreus]
MMYIFQYDLIHDTFSGTVKAENKRLVHNGKAISIFQKAYIRWDDAVLNTFNASSTTNCVCPLTSHPGYLWHHEGSKIHMITDTRKLLMAHLRKLHENVGLPRTTSLHLLDLQGYAS